MSELGKRTSWKKWGMAEYTVSVCVCVPFYSCADQSLMECLYCLDFYLFFCFFFSTCKDILAGPHKVNH